MGSVFKGTCAVLLLAMPLFGCDSERRESAACVEARDVASRHLQNGDLDGAQSALRTAESECGKASEYAIDRLQRAIERETRHREREAQLMATRTDPVDRFMDWVQKEREAKNRAQGEHRCAPRESPDHGFCVSKIVRDDGLEFVVRYWKAAPDEDFRFSFQTPDVISCVDLGPHRVVSSWQTSEGTVQLCELTEHASRGLMGLITRNDTSTIDVFSTGYSRRDSEFAKRLERR